jgi:tRNA threonylcarbamoyladenosine biosynthesis protein TsaE
MTTPATTTIPVGRTISNSESETFELGVRIGQELRGGEVVLLNGSLGAGKTVLVKGIAHALGLDEEDVTSPSFTLVNPHQGRLLLYHIDLYRLDEGVAAAHAVDLDEILTDESAVVVIEWGERMGKYPLPAPAWNVSITGDGDAPRQIVINEVESDSNKEN